MAYKRNRYGSIIIEGNDTFIITQKEQEEFKRLLKRANTRRYDKAKALYKDIGSAENMKGVSYDSYMTLLEEGGFITEKYSGKYTDYKTKHEFLDTLKELRQVTKKGYGQDRIINIRYKMIERINEEYGEYGKPLVDRIESLTNSELVSIYIHAQDDLIQRLYGSVDLDGEELATLVEKTLSDINYEVKGSKGVARKRSEAEFKRFKNNSRKKKKKKKRK